MKYHIEIATTDFITAHAAVKGGADRIELCSALSEGGLTSSFSLIKQCTEKFSIPVFPIIRTRGGDFLYDDDEFQVLKNDVLMCRQLGCDGVVFGALKKDGSIDVKKTGILRELAYPMEFTFHRAFDRCKDPFKALEELIGIGCQRILTSGQQPLAIKALSLVRQLVMAADNRIIIMPGGGIRPDNIKHIAKETGAIEFHASLRTTSTSKMEYVHPAFSSTDDYLQPSVDEKEVAALKHALQ